MLQDICHICWQGGVEKHLRVPIGMFMLEAAYENDIEHEGKDSNAYLVQYFAP